MRTYGPLTIVELLVAVTRRTRLASDANGASDRHLPGERITVPREKADEMVRFGHAVIIGPGAPAPDGPEAA
jgi:hypothetical protein